MDQAQKAGFQVDEVIADHGVSGIQQKLRDRPEGKRLFDKLRHGDHLVVRWVDRLGRNYEDVTDVIRHFIRSGVTIHTIINNMTFDGATDDPVQQAVRDALIGFLAATAQAQAEATKIAQAAGIEAAKANPRKYPGRKPNFDRVTFESAKTLLIQGQGPSAIAKQLNITRQAVMKMRDTPDEVEAILNKWAL